MEPVALERGLANRRRCAAASLRLGLNGAGSARTSRALYPSYTQGLGNVLIVPPLRARGTDVHVVDVGVAGPVAQSPLRRG